MPSVFTLTAAEHCPWKIKRGNRTIGCFGSKRAADKAARKKGRGWRPLGAAHPTRAGQRGLDPEGKRWHRSLHEERAIEEMDYITTALSYSSHGGQCSTDGVYTMVKLNRALARARCHLAAIGPNAGPRVRKLWRIAAKRQRRVDSLNNKLAKCLL